MDGITLFHIMYELDLGTVVFLKGAQASQRTHVAMEGIEVNWKKITNWSHGLSSIICVMVGPALVSA